jgi:phage-related minor tail protein
LAITASAVLIGKGVGVLAETERQMLRSEALLKSTGNASGQTGVQLDHYARAVARATLASTEGIRDAQAVLLTFKSVSGDTFTRAISLAQDMASVTGGDAKSSILQLGKALEEPAKGLSALTRSGVSFTAQETKKIKALTESGRLLAAQGLLLDKVAGQFGGAAQREAESFAGSVDTLGQDFDELAESLAKVTKAGDATKGVMDLLAQGFRNFKNDIDPEPVIEYNRLLAEQAEIRQQIQEMGSLDDLPSLNPIGYSKNDWYNVQRRGGEVSERLKELRAEQDAREKAMKKAQKKKDEFIETQKKERENSKKLAELEERRLKSQKESLQLAKSRGAKGTSLYSKLFAEDEKEPKNFTRNFNFESEAKSAKKFIDSGSTLAAEQFIDRAQASYVASKNYGWASNYDLQGMKDVVQLLREQAGLDYKDPDKDPRRSGISDDKDRRSFLEVIRENGDKLTLVSESSAGMAKRVEEYLEMQRQAIQGASKQSGPTKKFVLELAVPGKNKNLSITAETKDEFESSIASLFEGAASGL